MKYEIFQKCFLSFYQGKIEIRLENKGFHEYLKKQMYKTSQDCRLNHTLRKGGNDIFFFVIGSA